MAVQERDYVKGDAPKEGVKPGFLDRLNEIGERHAKLIITISTVLIIVTVIIFANVLYQRTLYDRLENDLAKATTEEQLVALQKKYEGSKGEPRVLLTLGHFYYKENKPEKALELYRDFLKKYPEHPLHR